MPSGGCLLSWHHAVRCPEGLRFDWLPPVVPCPSSIVDAAVPFWHAAVDARPSSWHPSPGGPEDWATRPPDHSWPHFQGSWGSGATRTTPASSDYRPQASTQSHWHALRHAPEGCPCHFRKGPCDSNHGHALGVPSSPGCRAAHYIPTPGERPSLRWHAFWHAPEGPRRGPSTGARQQQSRPCHVQSRPCTPLSTARAPVAGRPPSWPHRASAPRGRLRLRRGSEAVEIVTFCATCTDPRRPSLPNSGNNKVFRQVACCAWDRRALCWPGAWTSTLPERARWAHTA